MCSVTRFERALPALIQHLVSFVYHIFFNSHMLNIDL
jgi:hypothetical protein